VRETLKESYSHTVRPPIDPEVLLRMLLIGYLYGITRERRSRLFTADGNFYSSMPPDI
jgi:transposase